MSRRKCPLNENSLGGRLRIYREGKGHNIVQFSKILGISHGSLSEIENNRTKPSAGPINALIQKTDINIYWMFTGVGEMFKQAPTDSVVPQADVIDLEHSKMVHQFDDKGLAKKINRDLIEIERIDKGAFKRMAAKVEGFLEGLKESTEREKEKDREIAELKAELERERSRSRDPDAAVNET